MAKDVRQQDLEREAGIRRRVMEAATEVFVQEGVEGTTLETIAARAGVDIDTLLSLYPDRMDLMSRLSKRLYSAAFPFEKGWRHRSDLGGFLRTYLQRQQRPDVRLLWQLGDLLVAAYPDQIDAAYWHLVGELELRLLDAGLADERAHEISLVLTPATILVARRTAQGLTTQAELRDFVAAACNLAQSAGPTTPR